LDRDSGFVRGDDECFAISATYSETTDPYSDLASERQVFVRVSLRTIANGELSRQLDTTYTENDQVP
jgi:hypothetical protein